MNQTVSDNVIAAMGKADRILLAGEEEACPLSALQQQLNQGVDALPDSSAFDKALEATSPTQHPPLPVQSPPPGFPVPCRPIASESLALYLRSQIKIEIVNASHCRASQVMRNMPHALLNILLKKMAADLSLSPCARLRSCEQLKEHLGGESSRLYFIHMQVFVGSGESQLQGAKILLLILNCRTPRPWPWSHQAAAACATAHCSS